MKTTPHSALPRAGAASRVFLLALLAGAVVLPVSAKPGNGKGKGAGPDFVPPGHAEKGGPPGRSEDFVPPGHRRAPVEVIVPKAPPALRVEVTPPRPSPGHRWVPGYWVWQADTYVWVPGTWLLPPEPAAVWVPPRCESRSSVSVFISGYWRL